jgi:hypothetical protein
MPTCVSAPRAAPPPARTRCEPTRTWPSRSIPRASHPSAQRPRQGGGQRGGRVALEYALVARRYMGGDAVAYLAEIDQPGTRMARSRCAPPGSGSSTSRRGCPRPGRRDRLRPAAPSRWRHRVPDARSARPAGPDGASPSSLIATVRDYLPAGLSSVLASGTCERYSPRWRPCCSTPGPSRPWPSGPSPCTAATLTIRSATAMCQVLAANLATGGRRGRGGDAPHGPGRPRPRRRSVAAWRALAIRTKQVRPIWLPVAARATWGWVRWCRRAW